MKCFVCEHEVANGYTACPNCGYKFDIGESNFCPNSNFGKCSVTGSLCTKGMNFNVCPIKLEIDKGSF